MTSGSVVTDTLLDGPCPPPVGGLTIGAEFGRGVFGGGPADGRARLVGPSSLATGHRLLPRPRAVSSSMFSCAASAAAVLHDPNLVAASL